MVHVSLNENAVAAVANPRFEAVEDGYLAKIFIADGTFVRMAASVRL